MGETCDTYDGQTVSFSTYILLVCNVPLHACAGSRVSVTGLQKHQITPGYLRTKTVRSVFISALVLPYHRSVTASIQRKRRTHLQPHT